MSADFKKTSLTGADLETAQEFVQAAKSLFDRGYATGAAGNMSVMLSDGSILVTPTGSSMGSLSTESLSLLNKEGEHISGMRPTKEAHFHLRLYAVNPDCKAVVHLHSTYCTALSCIKDLNTDDIFENAFTPYMLMRCGKVPLLPYRKPGSPEIADDIEKFAAGRKACLLGNHGPITCGRSISEAVNNMEEFEATAEIFFLLHGSQINSGRVRYLTAEESSELLKGH